MKSNGVEHLPVPLGFLLNTLNALAAGSWWLSKKCHQAWLLSLARWGTREQNLEYHRRMSELDGLLDAKE